MLDNLKEYLQHYTNHNPDLIPEADWFWWAIANLSTLDQFDDDDWADGTDLACEILTEMGVLPDADPSYRRTINPIVEPHRAAIATELQSIFRKSVSCPIMPSTTETNHLPDYAYSGKITFTNH